MNKTIKIKEKLSWDNSRKYVLFLAFSVIGTISDFGVLKFLEMIIKLSTRNEVIIKNAYEIGNIFSYIVGVAIAFILSAKFAFKIEKERMAECTKDTIFTHISGWITQIAALKILIYLGEHNEDYVWITKDIAKTIAIGINGILMLGSNIFIVFRDRDKGEGKRKRKRKKRKNFIHASKWQYGCVFLYIERSFFICLIQSSRNHVTLPI